MSSSAGIRDKTILGPARNLSSRGPDLSQLKSPIKTSLSGTKQVIHALECGTGEVKEYLLEEINLMYECKTCFSVFRSIANLVAHKRSFCTSKYASLHHVYDDKGPHPPPPEVQTVVVEAEPVECVVDQQDISLENYAPSLELLKTAGVLEDISNKPLVNRLLPPGRTGLTSIVAGLRARQEGRASEFYQHRAAPPPPPPASNSQVVHLEPIYETDSGLMQSWRVSEDGETLGQTYRAWQEAEQEKQCYKVWPNGQVTSSKETIKLVAGPDGQTFSVRVPCDAFNSVEDIESEDEDTGYTRYPCPTCRKTYSKIMSVFRHMVAVHDITMQEAKTKRKMINNQSVYVEGRRRTKGTKVSETFNRPVKPVNVTLKNFTLDQKIPVNLCDKLSSAGTTNCPILTTSCLSDSDQVQARDKHKADALNRLVAEREDREKEDEDLDEEVDRKLCEFVNRRKVECRVCGEQFSRTYILKNHIAGQHLKLERWGCKYCQFGSWSKYQAVNHAVLEHNYSSSQSALEAVEERTKEEYFHSNPHCARPHSPGRSSRSETPEIQSNGERVERVNGDPVEDAGLVSSSSSNSPDSASSEVISRDRGRKRKDNSTANYNIKRPRRESHSNDDAQSTIRMVFSKVSPSVSPSPPPGPRPGPRSRTRQTSPSTGPSRESSVSGSDIR